MTSVIEFYDFGLQDKNREESITYRLTVKLKVLTRVIDSKHIFVESKVQYISIKNPLHN